MKSASAEDVFGPLEVRILRAMWHGGPSSVGEITDALAADGGRHPAYTTVMTVLGRLLEKMVVRRVKRGRLYVWEPVADESDLVESVGQRAVDRLVDRYGATALRQFAIRVADLDPALRTQLMDLAQGDSE